MKKKKALKTIWLACYINAVKTQSPEDASSIADRAVSTYLEREKEGFHAALEPSLKRGHEPSRKPWEPADYDKIRHLVPDGVDPDEYNNFIDACIASRTRARASQLRFY
ncbi:hypothetical protein [Xanthomonas hortorum]|uniref:Uncharacterized protein n=1 Tax=Xanthomonas hortorum pv. hederae TaxID=453603 RepID=A0A9X4BW03_9XANT|nr:hypothetical protein [Xanthomonas hortorum]MCE4373674.1 hypothetical protein [Xanthomonas hortorum pv. hederae]MDC8640605.1 hypothetical protein [Xanthomonas hortorum pv. hederae]